jgi:hypothetical protein
MARREPRAIWALVVGVVAALLNFDLGLSLFLALIALGLGIWALVRIRRSRGHLVGTWFAVGGMLAPVIVGGYFVTQLVLVYLLSLLFQHSPTTSEAEFGNHHKIYLEASYSVNIAGINAFGYADVPDGTPAQMQVTGPISWTCPGFFHSHPEVSDNNFRNLPLFKVGDADAIAFSGPPGKYTVILTIPSFNATVSRTFDAGPMGRDSQGSWYRPTAGCVQTATT